MDSFYNSIRSVTLLNNSKAKLSFALHATYVAYLSLIDMSIIGLLIRGLSVIDLLCIG